MPDEDETQTEVQATLVDGATPPLTPMPPDGTDGGAPRPLETPPAVAGAGPALPPGAPAGESVESSGEPAEADQPAPAPAPPLEGVAADVESAIRSWLHDRVANSPVSEVVGAWNHLVAELPALRERILEVIEEN